MPSRVVISLYVLLALVLWPGVLISPIWFVGDVRWGLIVLSLVNLGLAARLFVRREAFDRAWHRAIPDRRTAMFVAISLGFALVLALGLAEVGLRIVGRPFPRTIPPSEMAIGQYDPDLGWSYRPGISAVREFGTDARPIEMHFNDIGARVAAPGIRFDPARPTLILVGGSFTMGHGVTYEESLAGQLEALPGLGLQVVNLGVQAYGTDQSLMVLRKRIAEFDTRVVIYGYLCDHIKRNSVPDRHWLAPRLSYPGTKPQFEVGPDGRPVQVARPRRFEELRYSHLAMTLRVLRARKGPARGYDVTRALVAEMQRVAEEHGARFLVVDWRIEEPDAYCPASPFEGLGIDVIDTSIDAPDEWWTWRIPGDGHPTAEAYRRVARLVEEALARPGS